MNVDPWFNAAANGDVRFIARNYLSNAKRTEPNPPYQTAMMKAAETHNLSIVKLLLSHEKRLTTPEGWTSLMSAAKNGFTDIVETLFPHEAGFRTLTTVSPYKPNTTALLLAATHGHDQIVKLLYDREAELSGWTPLFLAAYNVDFGALNTAFSSDPGLLTSVAPRDNYNRTPLMYLVMHRRDTLARHDLGRCIKLLIRTQEGAQDAYGKTALMYAVTARHRDAVRYLLDLTTTEINKHTYDETDNGTVVAGKTALMLAVEMEDYTLCDMLSRYEIGRTTQSGITSLMLAVSLGNLEICKLLAPYENSFSTVSATAEFPVGSTALTIAKQYGRQEVVSLLQTIGNEPDQGTAFPIPLRSLGRIDGSLIYSSLYGSSSDHQLKGSNRPLGLISRGSSPPFQGTEPYTQPIIIPISTPTGRGDAITAKASYTSSVMRLSGAQQESFDDSALLSRKSNFSLSHNVSGRPKSAVLTGSLSVESPTRPMTVSELTGRKQDISDSQNYKELSERTSQQHSSLHVDGSLVAQSTPWSAKSQRDSRLQLEIENAVLNRKLYEADKKIALLQSVDANVVELRSELDQARETITQNQNYIQELEKEKDSTIQQLAREQVHNDVGNIIRRLSTNSSPNADYAELDQSNSNIELENLRADLDDKSTELQVFRYDVSSRIYPAIYELQSHFTTSHVAVQQKIDDITNKLSVHEGLVQQISSMLIALRQREVLKHPDLFINDLISGSTVDTTGAAFKASLGSNSQLSIDNAQGALNSNLELLGLQQKISELERENAILKQHRVTEDAILTSPEHRTFNQNSTHTQQDGFIISKLEETNNRLKAIESILSLLRTPGATGQSGQSNVHSDSSLNKTLTALEGELTLLKSSICQFDNKVQGGSNAGAESTLLDELDKNLQETRVFDAKFSELRNKVLVYKESVQKERRQNMLLSEQISKLTADLDLTTKQLHAAQEEVQALRQAKDQEDLRNNTSIKRREEELEDLRAQLQVMDDLESQVSALKTENALLENKVDHLQKDISVSTAELSFKERQLLEQGTSLQTLEIKHQRLVSDNEVLTREKRELEAKTECLLQEYDALQEEMKLLMTKNASSEESLRIMSMELKSMREGGNEEIKSLRRQLAEAESSLMNFKQESETTIHGLESRLRSSTEALVSIRNEIGASCECIEKARQRLGSADDLLSRTIGM
ncbi:Ankyrin repeat protein [Giardia duodenalis]|uniref:Ankyrin repeat protein n=1 Tax=Giardia intestinalis TaxID=5741 RepID=V6T7V0_GIAIN|nr:Ankyrin repeat protein [Giardia intestinalis]